MRPKLSPGIIVPFLVVGLLTTFAIVGALATRDTANTKTDAREQAPPSLASTDSAGTRANSAESEISAEGSAAAADKTTSAAAEQTGLPAKQKLIRTGQLFLTVAKGELRNTVDRIGSITGGMGGYVMSSNVGSVIAYGDGVAESPRVDDALSTKTDPPQSSASGPSVAPTHAWMTVRVPQRAFENALRSFSELGEVTAISTSSDDVTARYVDLRAQLRHHRAVERRLLRFLAETKSISEMLAVQDRIDAVQLTIEQLESQIKTLDETTTFATLSISFEERGASHQGQIDDSDTFAGVFWNSLTLLGRGARLTGLALTAALPFLAILGGIGLAVWYAIRRFRDRRQTRQQPSLPS